MVPAASAGPMDGVTDADRGVIEEAEATLRAHGRPGMHTTGAAVLTADGRTYAGMSLKADTGQADVHAEPVAVARARLDGARGFETVAAVQFQAGFEGETRVVSPCGGCREVLANQAPGVDVVLRGEEGLTTRPIEALLPF